METINNGSVLDVLTSQCDLGDLRKYTETKSVMKKRYGATNIHSMRGHPAVSDFQGVRGKLIQVTTPGSFAALRGTKE